MALFVKETSGGRPEQDVYGLSSFIQQTLKFSSNLKESFHRLQLSFRWGWMSVSNYWAEQQGTQSPGAVGRTPGTEQEARVVAEGHL